MLSPSAVHTLRVNLTLRTITVTPVDQRAAVGNALIDGLHADANGNRRMADTWWGGIQDALA